MVMVFVSLLVTFSPFGGKRSELRRIVSLSCFVPFALFGIKMRNDDSIGKTDFREVVENEKKMKKKKNT
jgi:hypothetical protein